MFGDVCSQTTNSHHHITTGAFSVYQPQPSVQGGPFGCCARLVAKCSTVVYIPKNIHSRRHIAPNKSLVRLGRDQAGRHGAGDAQAMSSSSGEVIVPLVIPSLPFALSFSITSLVFDHSGLARQSYVHKRHLLSTAPP